MESLVMQDYHKSPKSLYSNSFPKSLSKSNHQKIKQLPNLAFGCF